MSRDVCECGHNIHEHQSRGDEACMVRDCGCAEFIEVDENEELWA